MVLFYIFVFFVEVLTEFIHSSPKINEHPYAFILEILYFLSGGLFISVLFGSFSEDFSYPLIWNICLCLLMLHVSVYFYLCFR